MFYFKSGLAIDNESFRISRESIDQLVFPGICIVKTSLMSGWASFNVVAYAIYYPLVKVLYLV